MLQIQGQFRETLLWKYNLDTWQKQHVCVFVVLIKMSNLKTFFRDELEITVQRENGETQAQGAHPEQLGNFLTKTL